MRHISLLSTHSRLLLSLLCVYSLFHARMHTHTVSVNLGAAYFFPQHMNNMQIECSFMEPKTRFLKLCVQLNDTMDAIERNDWSVKPKSKRKTCHHFEPISYDRTWCCFIDEKLNFYFLSFKLLNVENGYLFKIFSSSSSTSSSSSSLLNSKLNEFL